MGTSQQQALKAIELVAAPTAIQPGGYVQKAYQDRVQATTSSTFINVKKSGAGFVIELVWDASDPVTGLDGNPRRFVDAAAILVPTTQDAPWITMGAPQNAIEGFLWKADKQSLYRIYAEGLGSVVRSTLPDGWVYQASHNGKQWVLKVTAPTWVTLTDQGRVGIAIWQGSLAERAGLKSVSPGWVDVL